MKEQLHAEILNDGNEFDKTHPDPMDDFIKNGIPQLPKECWLQQAFEYVDSKSHAPSMIIFWSIFAFAGASLKDRIWFDFAGKSIFPNFPLLIIAGSGIGKTSSLDIIERLFFEELPYRVPENVTSEALFKNFAQKGTQSLKTTSALWITPEMGATFGKKDYQSGIVASITRALDNPKNMTVSRMTGEDITIKNIALLNWICASTFVWLLEYCKEGTSSGGFLPRLETIHCQDDPKFTPFPSMDADVELELNQKLKIVLNEAELGKKKWTDEIEKVRYEYHNDLIACKDENVRNYIARQSESFARIYLILSVFLRKFRSSSEIVSVAKNCCKWLLNNKLSLYRSIIFRNILPSSKKQLESINRKFRKNLNMPLNYVHILRDIKGLKTDVLEPLLKFYHEHGVVGWNGKKGNDGVVIPHLDADIFLNDYFKNQEEHHDLEEA